jgi:hypothetical protein
MSRSSRDHFRDGFVYNGFDYDVQAWVIDGIVQRCGHRDPCRCFGKKYEGWTLAGAKEHEASLADAEHS